MKLHKMITLYQTCLGFGSPLYLHNKRISSPSGTCWCNSLLPSIVGTIPSTTKAPLAVSLPVAGVLATHV